MSQPGHATDWQSACIPPTIRRPWNVWENFLEDHVAEASSQAEEVTPEIREQIASVQAKGAKMAFLLLDESVQQQYIEVSYQELAAFANWRRSQVAQQESGAVPPATEFEGCWDLLNHDDKKEWLPQDPKAFLAADLQWAALVTNPLSGQEEADTEEVVWKDLLMTEAEDDSEVQGPLLTSDSEDHSEVSEDDAQQPGTPEFGRECKKLNADLKTHTARPEKADQQPLQMKTSESTEKERRMEERLQQLLESRKWLTVALDEAVGAVDNLELALQQQIQLTDLLQQLHRMQLEAAEQEFVNERMQYQQRLGDMEAQLAHQEQKFLASLAIAYGERDKERAELKAAKERRARELHEESLRTQIAHEEAAQLRREIAEVQSAREAADRSREAAEGELRLESARRKSAEQRGDDLQQQVDKVQTSATGPGFSSSETEVQLRMQVSSVTQQRDTLQQETKRLQQRLEAQRSGEAANAQLVQRFELALQAIGKLQEELEACQAQRDSYQKQCQRASQGAVA